MKVRTKTVEFEGVSFKIGALTFAQIENYATKVEGDKREIQIRNGDLIANALNNGLPPDAPESERWTAERCEQELDWIVFWQLFPPVILAFSGLEIKQKAPAALDGPPANPGEARATSVN